MKDRNELIADAMDIIGYLCEAKKCAMAQFFREAQDGHETAYILDRAFTYEWHINDAERFVTRSPDMKFDAEVQEAFDKLSKPSDECEAYVQERLAIYRITQTHEDGRLIGYPRDYPTALAALRGQEWTARKDGPSECPSCHERYQANGARKGHHGSCSLADLLHGRREPVANSTIRKGEMVALSAGFTAPTKPIVLSGMVAADKAVLAASPTPEREGVSLGPYATHGLRPWRLIARPEQLAPEGEWSTWIISAGRGWGKTRAASEWIRERVERGARRLVLVGKDDRALRSMVDGESGIRSISRSGNCPALDVAGRVLRWPSGAVAKLFTACETGRFVGERADTFWLENPEDYGHYLNLRDLIGIDRTLDSTGIPPRTVVTTSSTLLAARTTGPVRITSTVRSDPSGDAEAREARAIEAQRIDAELVEFQRLSKQRAASASPPFNAENVPESGRDGAVYDAFARGELVRDRGILYASYADWFGRLR